MLYLIVSETSKQQWLQKNNSLSPKCQSECKHSEVDMAVPVPRTQISSALAAWFPSALPWSSWLKMAYQLMCWVCVPTSGVMGHCTGMEGTTWKWLDMACPQILFAPSLSVCLAARESGKYSPVVWPWRTQRLANGMLWPVVMGWGRDRVASAPSAYSMWPQSICLSFFPRVEQWRVRPLRRSISSWC